MERIHFEDDLFFLRVKIRALGKGLKLRIDPDYFLRPLLEEIATLDAMVRQIAVALNANTHLLRRREYLLSLIQVRQDFVDFLETFLAKKEGFSKMAVAQFPQLTRIILEHLTALQEERDRTQEETSDHKAQFLSETELTYLMSHDEEEGSSS